MKMATVSLLLFSFIGLAFCDYNAFNTPYGGFNVTAGESIDLTWANLTSGDISIYLMPYVAGGLSAWSARIDIGVDNVPNAGYAKATIPTDGITTDGSQYYTFEIEVPSELNSTTDDPGTKNGTNYADHFYINPVQTSTSDSKNKGSSGLSAGAAAGIAVAATFVALMACFILYLRLTRKTRRSKDETADLDYRPSPHRDMSQREKNGYPNEFHTPGAHSDAATIVPSYHSSPQSPHEQPMNPGHLAPGATPPPQHNNWQQPHEMSRITQAHQQQGGQHDPVFEAPSTTVHEAPDNRSE